MTNKNLTTSNMTCLASHEDLAQLPAETLWLENFYLENTKATYRKALWLFVEYHNIQDLKSLRSISPGHVLAWREFLKESGHAPRTVTNRLSALSSMFKELADKQIVQINPVSGIKRPKVNNHEVEAIVFTQKQARRLLDTPNLATLKGLRDSAYLHILLYTGCRISETRFLQVGDLFEDKGYWVMEFQTKGGKKLRKAVNQEVQIAIRRYLSKASHGEEHSAALLQPIKRSGKKVRDGNKDYLSRIQLTRIFREYATTASLPQRVTPHSTRATFATVGLENGVPIQDMQAYLGHADVSTTRSYYKSKSKYRDSAGFKVHY